MRVLASTVVAGVRRLFESHCHKLTFGLGTPQRTPHVPGLGPGSHQVVACGDHLVFPHAEAVVAALSDM